MYEIAFYLSIRAKQVVVSIPGLGRTPRNRRWAYQRRGNTLPNIYT